MKKFKCWDSNEEETTKNAELIQADHALEAATLFAEGCLWLDAEYFEVRVQEKDKDGNQLFGITVEWEASVVAVLVDEES